MTEAKEEISDKDLADRLRANWLQVKDDAVQLGWRGYKTRVSLLDYKTWSRFELSHFQTMSERVDISRSNSTVESL